MIFASADYYPLLPWIFLFLAATGWARPFSSGVPRSSATGNTSRALGWIGRHALIIFLQHQPVVYGVLWLADWLL